jgi:hypothetical protein
VRNFIVWRVLLCEGCWLRGREIVAGGVGPEERRRRRGRVERILGQHCKGLRRCYLVWEAAVGGRRSPGRGLERSGAGASGRVVGARCRWSSGGRDQLGDVRRQRRRCWRQSSDADGALVLAMAMAAREAKYGVGSSAGVVEEGKERRRSGMGWRARRQ